MPLRRGHDCARSRQRVTSCRAPPLEREEPACAECGALWYPADEERWRLVLSDVDETAWYCAECAEREFGH